MQIEQALRGLPPDRGKRQADAEISNPPWRAQQWNTQPGAFPKQGQTPHE